MIREDGIFRTDDSDDSGHGNDEGWIYYVSVSDISNSLMKGNTYELLPGSKKTPQILDLVLTPAADLCEPSSKLYREPSISIHIESSLDITMVQPFLLVVEVITV